MKYEDLEIIKRPENVKQPHFKVCIGGYYAKISVYDQPTILKAEWMIDLYHDEIVSYISLFYDNKRDYKFNINTKCSRLRNKAFWALDEYLTELGFEIMPEK